MDPYDPSLLPFVIAGFIVAFLLAFGVGANDVANSFGTSVGSRVLSLRTACILATIFETMGAIMIGYKVSDTVRKGILDVTMYNNSEKELMLGSLAALGGSSIWNLVATSFSLPISGTHTIVGATVGFSLCARGFNGVNWKTFGKIVASWFVSPLLSGAISAIIYMCIKKFILSKSKPVEPGLRCLPFFYGFTILVNFFSIIHDGPPMPYLDRVPWWGAAIFSVSLGMIVAIVVQCVVVPKQRKLITGDLDNGPYNSNVKFTIGSSDSRSRSSSPQKENGVKCPDPSVQMTEPSSYPLLAVDRNGYMPISKNEANLEVPNGFGGDSTISAKVSAGELAISNNNSQAPLVDSEAQKYLPDKIGSEDDGDTPEVARLFSFLQIMTASFGSFAHGGNDVSNAIGPLIAVWAIYSDGSVDQTSHTPLYILLYGGVGISVGLWVWGRKVIKTIGESLTKVTPSSGFTIEIGSAFTVLMASKAGLPISTTHCKVGSVVFVGWVKSSREGVDWKLFRNIVLAWVVTVPLTAGISALLMLIFKAAFL